MLFPKKNVLNEKQGKDTKLNDRFMTSPQQNNRLVVEQNIEAGHTP
jgi:hypothetical protein